MRTLGLDLAWGVGSATRPANESGVVALHPSGQVLEAGWTRGLDQTLAWVKGAGEPDSLLFVDAPLVVANPSGQRGCELEVGRRYGRWKVSANATNLGSPHLAGVALRRRLEEEGWRYDDGRLGPPRAGRVLSECYPYTTLVGAAELGYEAERPPYKRKPRAVGASAFRPARAAACDELIRRLARLVGADPPLDLASHPETARLVSEPSPLADRDYKHREDLLDAAVCAWSAMLWLRHGLTRSQVLGLGEPPGDGSLATIVAPARPEQRVSPRPRHPGRGR